MTALVAEALALAERHHITIALVGGDRLSWESRGPTSGRALKALRAAKLELVDLLARYQLDSSGALAGDGLLADLRASDFAVRRYNRLAGIDDDREPVFARAPAPPLLYAFSNKRAEYSCALRALGAQDRLAGLRETDEATKPETAERLDAAAKARDLIDRVRDLGFRAYLDRGALLISDTTGQRRDLSRFISPALLFEVLNAGLDDDPALLDPREDSPSCDRRKLDFGLNGGRTNAEIEAMAKAIVADGMR